ncbi:NXPE family member 3-like [Branchiostoma floridae x Branchiostoma belcheri]
MVYISEELDRLQGGPDVVVVITIWFHFLMEPIHIYRKRIVAIRDAILRLHQRQPATLVLIKSGNMAFSSLWAPTHVGNYLMADDWMSEDLDRLQREVFSPTRAVFLDVWDMTACHRAQHDIHPPSVIVAAEVRLALAYICPT